MTFPVEGGSFEADHNINQDSDEMKLIKDIDDTEQLKEGGSNQITYSDLKRSHDSSVSNIPCIFHRALQYSVFFNKPLQYPFYFN